MLQDSLVFDTSRDALASPKVKGAAQSLEVEAHFSVLTCGGLPKVKKNSGVKGV